MVSAQASDVTHKRKEEERPKLKRGTKELHTPLTWGDRAVSAGLGQRRHLASPHVPLSQCIGHAVPIAPVSHLHGYRWMWLDRRTDSA
ncbi:hypothetical protein VTN96DRAFT_1912 [Rasamsonia emersonii]